MLSSGRRRRQWLLLSSSVFLQAHCSREALRKKSGSKCGDLNANENARCSTVVRWANKDGKWDDQAASWFADMQQITGKTWEDADEADFQRLYYCSPPGGDACALPPCSCSSPPCNSCFAGEEAKARPQRPGCDEPGASEKINCVPPKSPMGYKGRAWPTMTFEGKGEMHIMAIGDWGGMDGSLNPIEGRNAIVAYGWGKRPGPSVFPRTRWDKAHDVQLCDHKQFVECFESRGTSCHQGCGYVAGVDDQPQMLVAAAFKARAAEVDPQFIINVGDNFYWGGIEKNCGTPMDEMSFTARHQFDQIFEGIYQGEGLTGKPWLSVLGNHDWGGRVFNNGWDQQIAYTWFSDRWILPAPYWSQHVEYPDQDFSLDIYMLDSNFIDAKHPSEDPEHNICGEKHNPPGASCTLADGPDSLETCPAFFQQLWDEQVQWLERTIASSKATWRIVVTHFPCGHEQDWYKKLHDEMRLDLLVTGHRHDQELWLPESYVDSPDYIRNKMGGLVCIVTGGGGGITSEASPDPANTTDWYGEAQYGFYDLAITKKSIHIESVNWNGTTLLSHTIYSR